MDEINKQILKIWEEFGDIFPKEKRRYPLLFPNPKEDSILFIGINPSFSEKGFNQTLKETKFEKLNIKKFYSYPNESFNIETSIEIEELARDKHDYFKKFRKFKKEVGKEWEHLDLFFFREKTQKDAEKIIEYSKGKMNKFGKSQIELSLKAIEIINPRLIIVNNALASKIIQGYYKIESKNFEEEGFDRMIIGNKKVPIFFSSMFTGQRALDNESYRRLLWQVKKYFKK